MATGPDGPTGPDGGPAAEVVAHGGDDVVVRLEDRSGSTGYQWWVVDAPDLLVPQGDRVEPHRPDRTGGSGEATEDGGDVPAPVVGAPGEHVFTYRAAGAGEGVLAFALRRAWEPDPVATVAVRVVVS